MYTKEDLVRIQSMIKPINVVVAEEIDNILKTENAERIDFAVVQLEAAHNMGQWERLNPEAIQLEWKGSPGDRGVVEEVK